MTEDIVHDNTWLLHMTMWMYVPVPEIEELKMVREECSTTGQSSCGIPTDWILGMEFSKEKLRLITELM